MTDLSTWLDRVATELGIDDAALDNNSIHILLDLDGRVLCIREDVGRHNAVDKVVGWALRQGRLPLHDTMLLVSGRASFELAQKAVLAGIPILAAVSAPSSLAVELAEQSGLTLIGFLREDSMNIYAHSERVLASADAAPPD